MSRLLSQQSQCAAARPRRATRRLLTAGTAGHEKSPLERLPTWLDPLRSATRRSTFEKTARRPFLPPIFGSIPKAAAAPYASARPPSGSSLFRLKRRIDGFVSDSY